MSKARQSRAPCPAVPTPHPSPISFLCSCSLAAFLCSDEGVWACARQTTAAPVPPLLSAPPSLRLGAHVA
eukprot:1882610-Rhodomonas_salina.1